MKRVANVWDRFYRYHESPWRGERPVADLLPLLGDGPVLELGCGNGKTLKPLLAAGVDVVGLDISWHILRRLREDQTQPAMPPQASTPQAGRRAPRLVLADASWLPFADATFTAVLDIHCTGHLLADGRRRAAADIHRVLRPGGHVVVERLTPEDLRGQQGAPLEGSPEVRALQDGRTTAFMPREALAAEFMAAGFIVEGGAVDRHHPGHRGRQVTREAVRLLLSKPA